MLKPQTPKLTRSTEGSQNKGHLSKKVQFKSTLLQNCQSVRVRDDRREAQKMNEERRKLFHDTK